MGKKVGIDLGTTYSVVSYVDETQNIVNIESSEGEKTTPSIVFFDPNGETVTVGSVAREAGAMNPECLVERIKNYMGDPDYRATVNGVEYSASAVSTLILKKLIADAELALGGDEIEGAVITCPAYFGDAARAATRLAGENVTLANGKPLKVLKIMDEPTAAAIAYGNSKNENIHKTVLIYDLGGGTFDCTVMRLDFEGTDRKYQVITTGGNHQLGGKDWDAALANYVKDEFCNNTGVDRSVLDEDPEMKAFFSEKIEAAKKMLTAKPTATVTPSFDGNKYRVEITQEKFDELTADLFNQTILLIDDMLTKKGMSIDEIDEIILVGGSTRMKQVEAGLTAQYNKPLVSFDPDKAVSNGAALVASGLVIDEATGEVVAPTSEPSAFGSDANSPFALSSGASTEFAGSNGTVNKVVELCTKSYCFRYYNGGEERYYNLIVKDTPKPASASYAQLSGGQGLVIAEGNDLVDSINLKIMENESLNADVAADECAELYEDMPIAFSPAIPASTPVDIQLDVDMNGQLTLTLIEINSGVKHVLKPVRKGGDADKVGMDVASKLTLA